MKSVHTLTRQSGLTLIEMVIAVAIGLFLIVGIIEIFIGNKVTFRNATAQSRLQENGRFVTEFLSAELRNIGNIGCAGPGAPLNNTLNDTSGFAWNFENPIEGFEAKTTDWLPALDTEISAQTPTLESDILVVRIPVGAIFPITSTTVNSSTATTSTQEDIVTGDIALISDCEEAAIFQVTSVLASGGLDTFVHITGPGTPGNAESSLGKSFDKAGQIRKLATVTYFVDRDASGKSALWRMQETTAEELIEGVENMQILYGVAPAGVEATKYVTADHVSDWQQVTNIRIRFLVASLQDNLTSKPLSYTFNGSTVTPTDKRLRRIFTSTVNIRNRG